jgi:hypothetical protein
MGILLGRSAAILICRVALASVVVVWRISDGQGIDSIDSYAGVSVYFRLMPHRSLKDFVTFWFWNHHRRLSTFLTIADHELLAVTKA